MKCVEMRRSEIDWDTIAEKLGYGCKQSAHSAFIRFMREYPRDDVEQMRDLELDKIERKCLQLEPECAKGNPRAIEVWNKLSERRSRLCGWDKPERREVHVLSADTVNLAIEKLSLELNAKAAANDLDLSQLVIEGELVE